MRFWREVDGLLLRQAADQAEHVRAAFIQSVPVDSIVNRWADSRTDGERISPQAARDWANNNIQLPEKALKDALDHVYATGWVIGDDASTAAYAHAKLGLKKAAPTGPQISAAINTDWANWKPGNRPAAALVRPPNGLKKLLDKSGATVKEINGTTLDRIGTLLADSLNSGASYDSLARNLLRDTITSSVIKDSARAQMIAVTEMSRALNTSTVDNYGTFGVEKVEWLAIDTGTCEICPANEAQGPIPIGEMFESGDTEPPAHPNCRCTILPVVDEGAPVAGEAAPAEDFSTDEMEISDVADHGIEDVVAGQATVSSTMSEFVNPLGEAAATAENNQLAIARQEYLRNENADYARRAAERAQTDATYARNMAYAKKQLEGIQQNGEVTIATRPHVLESILGDGRYKNQFETGTSGGTLDEFRVVGERTYVNIPLDLPPTQRPIYGYITTQDNKYIRNSVSAKGQWSNILSTANDRVRPYGEISVVLKPGVKSRTTITIGDSLNAEGIAKPLTGQLSEQDLIDLGFVRNANPMARDGVPFFSYVEAQVSGGVSVSDISRLVVDPVDERRVRRLLEQYGVNIPIEIRGAK